MKTSNRLTIRKATANDAEYLAPRLRKADLEEIAAAGQEPLKSMHMGIACGGAYVVVPVGNPSSPIAIFGFIGDPGNGAIVWMLATDDLVKYKMEFLVKARDAVDAASKKYGLLYNRVYRKNLLHIRWLKWMGFTFVDDNQPFIFFYRQCANQ